MPYALVAPAFQSVARPSSQRILAAATRLSSTLTLSPDLSDATQTPEASTSAPQDFLRYRKFHELKDSLTRGGSPSRVWSYYTDLLNVMGYDQLPLQVHQSVLRKCTPPSAQLRVSAARRIVAENVPSIPHIHEGRFQTVIRNIRAIDQQPALEDYHFILEQFAAVGHHVGAMQVYKEITKTTGITPRTKTFGLCLQAIAHRLTLPIEQELLPQRTTQTHLMMSELISDMQSLQVPFTSAILDLTIRILKETVDVDAFEKLMTWGYGIDLSNPDRLPLHPTQPTLKAALGIAETPLPGLSVPQPFSTAALNTTIDILGRFGNVSKLVQAFEVLTQPLPRANEHLFSSFDDDDDFGVADNPKTHGRLPPHAIPNTTTYNMLIRHLCRAGHATLARHYLLQAMKLDRTTDSILRYNVYNYPLRRVFAPHFAINRGTLLPVFGHSNRDKDVALMRWLSSKIPSILKRKKGSLQFFTTFKENMEKKAERRAALFAAHPNAAPNSAFRRRPASAPSNERLPSLLERKPVPKPNTSSVFEVDVENSAPPSPPAPIKRLDIDLHLRVLQRDIEEIEAFQERLRAVLGRNTQRVKERLGRRVWAGKDVYMADEGQRRKVTRQEWQRVVGFKPKTVVDARSKTGTARVDTPSSLSTYFHSNQVAAKAGQGGAASQTVPKHFTSTLKRR